MEQRRRRIWPWLVALVVFGGLAVVVVSVVLPEVQKLLKLKEDVVRFQKAAQVGPGAFTPPADVRANLAAAGAGAAASGGGQTPPAGGGGGGGTPSTGQESGGGQSGTFGGSGSDRVCDREKLIKYLLARPEQLKAWAKTLGIEATPEAIEAYIRKLRPVILTRDTQVTNHAYKNGAVSAYQAIMQKGTAVLVDKDGKPVTRCRCGNPLKEPIKLADKPKCIDCPRNYKPPPPCDYVNYDDAKFESYGDQEFNQDYQSSDYKGTCYKPDPDPPPVEEDGEPPPEEECENNPDQPECAERCQQEPAPSYCPQTDQTTPDGEGTDGLQAPSDGQTVPPDGQTAPPDGGTGEAPSGGEAPPPQ